MTGRTRALSGDDSARSLDDSLHVGHFVLEKDGGGRIGLRLQIGPASWANELCVSKSPVIRWSTLSLLLCGRPPEILNSSIFEFAFHKHSAVNQWSYSRSLESWLTCLPGSRPLPCPAPWHHSEFSPCTAAAAILHPRGHMGARGSGGRTHMPRAPWRPFPPHAGSSGPIQWAVLPEQAAPLP